MPKTYRWPLSVALFVMWASFASAQDSQAKQPEHQMQSNPASLSDQIRDLSHQVSELASKVKEQGVDTASMKANGDERRAKMSMGILGGSQQAISPQPLAPAVANSQMADPGMMVGMMSMMNSMMGGMGGGAPMGQAASMGPSSVLSALPGFPGASHLYHIGSTDFFLDHPQHILPSLQQQSLLADIRTQALLRRSEFNRRIQELEEQLWLLTASDMPNLSSIEAKVREIEKLHGDGRLTFIKDVGEAAKVLTNEQRQTLLGQISPTGHAAPTGMPASQAMGGR